MSCRREGLMRNEEEEEEEEEEEILVHVEFDSIPERDLLDRDPVFFKMIGLDEKNPLMQIGNQTFSGEYQDIVGTALFFEEDPTPAGGDPVFSRTPEHQLRYICKTRRALRMSRVFLKNNNFEPDPETVFVNKNLHNSSSDELTMEVDEDPVLLEHKKKSEKKKSDELATMLEATASGISSVEVENLVEKQITQITNPES